MTITRREELNLQAINVDKDIHTVVKKFCEQHGLVYSKFVGFALKDRMIKVSKMFAEMDADNESWN